MPDGPSPTLPSNTGASRLESLFFTLLRVGVGWHFAYEGVVKLSTPNWTSAPYLQSASWLGADLFHWMAANPAVLRVVDLLNMWGLLLIGGALMLGALTRFSAILGVLLLALYYVAHPALFTPDRGPAEGSYLIVNKNLVELLALCVLAARPHAGLGVDHLLTAWRRRRQWKSAAPEPTPDRPESAAPAISRRHVLAGLAGTPFLGAFVLAVLRKKGYFSHEENQLAVRIDALSAPSMKPLSFETLDDLKGKIPAAKIGNVELSRVMLGGNLMNGFAHARDLIYVSKLIKAYHHQDKVFETFRLAEACGINAIITNPILAPMITAYWNYGLGKIQFVAQCKGKDEKDFLDNIRFSLDSGACAAYIQGQFADACVQEGKFDCMAKGLQMIRDQGLPAGIGGHSLKTIVGSVDHGLQPDFWMKTLHHHKYWSARVDNQHDNMWCEEPEETIAYMQGLPQPWIAFKVLAAGAIHPKDGFRYAFANGADFLCVGMYDFQVVENANIALRVLRSKIDRQRPWRA